MIIISVLSVLKVYGLVKRVAYKNTICKNSSSIIASSENLPIDDMKTKC